MDAHRFYAWLDDWWSEARARLRRPWIKGTLLAAFGFLLLRLLWEEGATWLAVKLLTMIPDLIALPMGYGGLALIAILVGVFVSAAIAVHSRVDDATSATEPTIQERRSVDDLRVMVRSQEVRQAYNSLHGLLQGTQYRHQTRGNLLADFVEVPRNAFAKAWDGLHKAINEKYCPLLEARRAFATYFEKYNETARALHRIADRQIREDPGYDPLYEEWRKADIEFVKKLDDLRARSDYEGVVNVNQIRRSWSYNIPGEIPDESSG